jgi:hypothetical protein
VVGPRTLRLKAETEAADGLQDATAIDVVPFAVVATSNQAPPPPTTAVPTGDSVATSTPVPVTPAPVTPVPTADVPPATGTTTPDTPPVPTTTTGTGSDSTQGVLPGGVELLTPDPAECAIAPRALDALRAIVSTPDQTATDALLAAMAIPGLAAPAGQPADAETTAAVLATYREMTACFNAGRDLAAYALWTDRALRQMRVQAPASDAAQAVPAERQAAVGVTGVWMLPDGRVVAQWQEQSDAFATAAVQILVPQDGRYLIDETLDVAAA